MANDKRKVGFCESKKCSFLMFLIVVGAIAAVVCVTFLDKDLRSIYDHGESGQGLKWWQTTIIYQIYPRSFQDSNGDGIGDLQGIISRLDYFKYINVGAIWLSPFFESPMKDFGYDVKNYTAVDAMFGTMSDFDELMKNAKDMGIKVIIDFVPNHTSDESEWFQRSRNATDESDPYWDFYIWNEGRKLPNGSRAPPNNWQSVFEGSTWEYDSVRGAYYYHAFLKSQPDLNYRNPKVLEKVGEVIRFWMDKGVDGLRIDAIPHLFEAENQTIDEPAGPTNGLNPNLYKYTKHQPEIFDVVRQWRAILNDYDDRFLLAEASGIPHEARMQYYEAGSVPFYFGLINAKQMCNATAVCLQQLIEEGMNVSGNWPNFVIGNHDNKRIADTIGEQYADAMNVLLLTLPGTPTTYYGEELGMKGGDYKGLTPQDPFAITSNNPENSRDSERNPMQWNTSTNAGFTSAAKPWLLITSNTDYQNVNVEVMKGSNTSSLNLYRRLAELRRQPAFQTTNIEFFNTTNQLLMYRRYDADTNFVVAINVQQHEAIFNIANSNKGTRVFSTKSVIEQNIELKNIKLQAGEGIIVRLDN